jgi:nitrite reductase (NADH) small subunit
MKEVNVGMTSSFADPGRKVIAVDGVEIGVFCLNGEFLAYENICPHMAGPACQGKIIPKVDEIIAEDRTSRGLVFSKKHINVVCPWHGYEFDIRTGRHHGNTRLRLKPVKVRVVDGEVLVTIPESSRDRITGAARSQAAGGEEAPLL